MKNSLVKIEFWIFLFFLIRLIGITNPPLETGHNWRQVTGLMVARNFTEIDSNIFQPQTDDNNGKSGIIGMEFPTLNYLHFIISKVFGYTHWYGRIINLFVTSIGLLFFYKIIDLFFNKKLAFTSTIILTTSIWFAFSRKMMPDTFCVSVMFIGLHYGINYLNNNKLHHLIAYISFCSLAFLTKIPAGIYFLIISIIILSTKHNLKNKAILAISSLIPFSLTYYWYFIWNPNLSSISGNWYNVGRPFTVGFFEIFENMNATLKNFYFNSFSSYFLFVLFIIGLVLIFFNREKKLILTFGGMLGIFAIYMFKSGFYFYHHNYYVIPFVPVMSLIAAYPLTLINKDWLFILFLTIGISESIANQQHDFFLKKSELYKMDLEKIADTVSERDDLIVINGNQNPQQIYLTHRKGWVCNDIQLTDTAFINDITKKGCKYIFVNKHFFPEKLTQTSVFENEGFSVYKLNFENNTENNQ